jgi:hypothetical protein
VLFAVPFLIAAGPGLEYTPPTAPAAPDVAGLIFRLFGLTAAMIVLCGGVVWLVRRVKQPAAAKGDPTRLRHEGSLPLDRRCAVHLVNADGHTVAVTTDATGLRSLVVLSEPFEQALDDATTATPTPATPG